MTERLTHWLHPDSRACYHREPDAVHVSDISLVTCGRCLELLAQEVESALLCPNCDGSGVIDVATPNFPSTHSLCPVCTPHRGRPFPKRTP